MSEYSHLKNVSFSLLYKTLEYIRQHKIVSLALILTLFNFIYAISLNTQLNTQAQAFEKYQTQQFEQLKTIAGVINTNRKIYIYNPEQILASYPVINQLKTKYTDDLTALNTEVEKAKKQIKNVKDAKVKADFSDAYLNSLVLKRNTLVEEYQKNMEQAAAHINQILVEVAASHSAPTIFNAQAIGVQSQNVIDVTAEILQKL